IPRTPPTAIFAPVDQPPSSSSEGVTTMGGPGAGAGAGSREGGRRTGTRIGTRPAGRVMPSGGNRGDRATGRDGKDAGLVGYVAGIRTEPPGSSDGAGRGRAVSRVVPGRGNGAIGV